MKKNLLIIVAIVLVGSATFTLNSLRAQNTPPPAGQPPTPASRPGPMPGARPHPVNWSRQAIMVLKMARTNLQNSKDDYNGHRQSALDAVIKAEQELEAVQSAIQAEAAAAKAAEAAKNAQQATPPGAPPAATPPPAPAPGQ